MTTETADGFGEAESREALYPSPPAGARGSTALSARVGVAVCLSSWAHTLLEPGGAV